MNTNTGRVFEVPMSQGAVPMKEATAAKVGFRELTASESDAVRAIREQGAKLEALLIEINTPVMEADQRWISISRTHFQEGLMAAVRAIAKPAFF